MSKNLADFFFKFLWPSQNILTLIHNNFTGLLRLTEHFAILRVSHSIIYQDLPGLTL